MLYDSDKPTVDDFNRHIEILVEFMKLLFEDSETFNMRGYFTESLMEEYRSRGIYRDEPSTWQDKTWPTLHDLRERWKRDSADKNVSALGLVNRSPMVDLSWDYLNRPTNIDLSADYLVIDLSGIQGSLREPMNFLAIALLSMRYNAKAQRETIICIDEGSFILHNPNLLYFMTQLFKLGRSYKLACWFINQEPSGLLVKGVGDILKMNSYIDVVFGHNLDDDNLSVVTQYYHLTKEEQGILKRCSPGQGLIKIGDSKTPIYVKLTDYEYACIKGKNHQKVSTDIGITLKNPALSELGDELYFDDWIQGSSATLAKTHIPKRAPDAFGSGTKRAWIRKDLINAGDMIGNESLYHYGRVGRIAGYLADHGVKTKIHHHDDVDIAADFSFGRVAFEMELPRSHSIPELLQKKEFAASKYDRVYFIGISENIDDLATVAGENAIPCGTTLKELLDNLIKENNK